MGPPVIVIAPDSFKTTMSAAEVGDALATGVRRAGGVVRRCPLADGGEGTASVLADALGAQRVAHDCRGPLGDPVTGWFGITSDGVGLVDAATASGLDLLPGAPDPHTARDADTTGTGQLVAAAVAAGAHTVLLGVGGTATTDGGLGACRAIETAGGLRSATLQVLCDVRTPYEMAAEVFAPQKGADPATVAELAARLAALAVGLPRDPRGRPRTGAAGGLAGGLWAALGAELVDGIDTVLDVVGFEALLAGADLVLTGEGRLDVQTAEGKVVEGVIRRVAGRVPVIAVAGRIELTPSELTALGLARAVRAGDTEALATAAAQCTAAVA